MLFGLQLSLAPARVKSHHEQEQKNMLNEFLKRHRLLIVLQALLLAITISLSFADEQFFGGVLVGFPLGWGILHLVDSFFKMRNGWKEDANNA